MINKEYRDHEVFKQFDRILKLLRRTFGHCINELIVNAKDRKRQVWERNSLGMPLWSGKVIWQKLAYIHDNPVKAGLCNCATDYKYSSAGFYLKGDKQWDLYRMLMVDSTRYKALATECLTCW